MDEIDYFGIGYNWPKSAKIKKPEEISIAANPNPKVCRHNGPNKIGRPRWYNQSYLVFLALRNAGKPLYRGELIAETLRLDAEIGHKLNLPNLFRGKTPQNTASAILTLNQEKYFLWEKPPGSKSTLFRLAYKPGDFDSAVEQYNQWMDKLVKDWAVLFSKKLNYGIASNEKGSKKLRVKKLEYLKQGEPSTAGDVSASVSEEKNEGGGAGGQGEATETGTPNTAIAVAESASDPPAAFQSAVNEEAIGVEEEEDIPKSIGDIVEVRESGVPNAGNGVFAKRLLPSGSFLGFYFGIPYTEDEYDALKDHIGQSSQYAHRYRQIVLDATDEEGKPFMNNPKVFCPFHFINETAQDPKANANVHFIEGNLPNQVIVMNSRDIQAGEELFVFYGEEVDRSHYLPKEGGPDL